MIVPFVWLVLRRRGPVGVALAILAAGVVTGVAGLLAVVFRTSTVPWFIAATVVVAAAGLVRRGWTGEADWRPTAGVGLVAVGVGVVWLLRAPVQWDARSIWFYHASWFADTSTTYVEAVRTAAVGHPEYPPYASAFAGYMMVGNANDWVAQTAIGVLTLAAVILLVRLTTRRALYGMLMAVVVFAVIRGNGLDGYVDGLAAVLLVILIVAPSDPIFVGVVAAAAALTKNESLLFLILIVVPYYMWQKKPVRPLLPGVGLGVAWFLLLRHAATTDWNVGQVLPWHPEFWDRFTTITADLTGRPVLLLAVLLWVGGALITGDIKYGVAGAGFLVALFPIYLMTTRDLMWHLDRSAGRLVTYAALMFAVGGSLSILGMRGRVAGHQKILRC